MQRSRRLALAGACAVSIASPAAATAAAASTPLGYAISAVGFNSYFVFDSRPGKTARGTLRVSNLSAEPRTILLSPVDVSTAATGGLQYGNGSPHRDGRWLRLMVPSVALDRTRSVDVPFTVTVPRRARAGDHFLAIVAMDRRVLSQHVGTNSRIRLRLIPRLAMTIRVTLPGALTRRLTLGRISIAVAPSGASVALRISNPANSLIPATTGAVTLSQDNTPLFTQSTSLAAFVPKTTITFHVPWEGTPVEGTYRVKGELRPAGAQPVFFDRTVKFGGGAIRQYRRQTGRQAHASSGTPVLLMVGFALTLAAAAAFGVAYTRARRQLRQRG